MLKGLASRGLRHISIATRGPLLLSISAGQPIHETRPHYLPNPGNLTPGISSLEYYERRIRLAKRLPEKSVAIIVGNQVQFSSGAVFYDFQQNNDLYYLTGWLEPDSVAIIEKTGSSGTDEDVILHMLVPGKDLNKELWEGQKLGLEGAVEIFNADEVEDVKKCNSYIESLLTRNLHVYWDSQESSKPGSSYLDFFGSKASNKSLTEVIRKSGLTTRPLTGLIAELRAIKSNAEIKVLHTAGQISSRAINKAIAKVGSNTPLYTEKTLAKYLEYQFVKGGCDKQAYIPVVASGENALTIHYTRNDDLLYQDELVFIDAGGKLGGYCADISRTWPNSPNGFSEPQRDLYEVVLNTNRKCIELCDESLGLSLHDIYDSSVKYLYEDLRNLPGFQAVTRAEISGVLYPHYIGHHLGLDLHDVPQVSRFQKLVEGNVITIEPGLYIPKNNKWPKSFQGIGIRVEDNIVVGKTNDEIINLSSGCVKEVVDIESLIRSGKITTPGNEEELVVLDI